MGCERLLSKGISLVRVIFMITIGQLGMETRGYDETWAIVRSLKKKKKSEIRLYDIRQVIDLSPSRELFNLYRKWVAEGYWNEDTFNTCYVPTFLRQLKHDKRAKDKLNELYLKDKQGKKILLLCYCKDEHICHRSIIAGVLMGVGCNVVVANKDNNYIIYDAMYRALK